MRRTDPPKLEERRTVSASADSAERIKDTTGVSPWSFIALIFRAWRKRAKKRDQRIFPLILCSKAYTQHLRSAYERAHRVIGIVAAPLFSLLLLARGDKKPLPPGVEG